MLWCGCHVVKFVLGWWLVQTVLQRSGLGVLIRVRVCSVRLVKAMSECLYKSRSVFASCFDYWVSSHEYEEEVAAHNVSMASDTGAQ